MGQREKKVLHLTLKKKWFDMIARGEKKEEYRDRCPHWFARLVNRAETNGLSGIGPGSHHVFKEWDVVTFSHGYQPDAPRVTVEFVGIGITTGKPEWGAEPGKEYFVIKLGNIIKSSPPKP